MNANATQPKIAASHVYRNAAIGAPHDHGSSRAIYGLAEGDTEMVDWRVTSGGLD